jgi:hypothetical protein
MPHLDADGCAWNLQHLTNPADEHRWLVSVHQLAWRPGIASLLCADRATWVPDTPGPVYLPYDAAELQRILAVPWALLAQAKERVSIPPKHYVSTLRHDVFTASVYAIDLLLARSATAPEN